MFTEGENLLELYLSLSPLTSSASSLIMSLNCLLIDQCTDLGVKVEMCRPGLRVLYAFIPFPSEVQFSFISGHLWSLPIKKSIPVLMSTYALVLLKKNRDTE